MNMCTLMCCVCLVCVVLCVLCVCVFVCVFVFFCQAEDGIRDLVRSRGLGDVYKRQPLARAAELLAVRFFPEL